MKTKLYIIILLIILTPKSVNTQTLPDSVQTFINPGPNPLDSIPSAIPSTPSVSPTDLSNVKISEESVEEQVDYDAQDSMFFDTKNKQIHLYGQAVVTYTSMTIKADYILIDWNDNTIIAEGRRNALGKMVGKPEFTEGTQDFTAGRMKYNFKTSKGIIYDAATMQEGMQVRSEKAKYISSGNDTTQIGVIYNSCALFTTCDHDHPHFGVRSRKQKVVPDKVAVVGPSNIEIMGIPTPIWLPFGFFPLKQGKRTGLLFPGGYQYSETFGFGLERVGWYFPINDYWDLQLTGDIYMKGTFRIHADTRYRRRYKNSGNLNVDFAYLRSEEQGRSVFNPSTNIRWSHNQDAKAHPTRTFRGSLNLQTNNYRETNQNDAQSVLQSSLSSNISLSQKFNAPFTLSASFGHSQNTRSREVRINFPQVSIQSQTMYPFKSKKRGGNPEKWYEKVTLRYTGEMRNQLTATDSTLFTSQTLRDAQYGVRHSIGSNVNFRVLKYFNLAPSVNYKEVWYLNTIRREFDPTVLIQLDTIYNPDDSLDFTIENDTLQAGKVLENEVFGFEPLRQYDMSLNLNTQLFGTLLFKRGWLRGVRHHMKPSLSFRYSPDYTNPDWGYFETVQTDLEGTQFQEYNIFQNGIFDKPSSSGRQMSLNYSITNIFEAKTYSKKDSIEKKLSLLRNVGVSGNYNFAADSLNWSRVSVSGNTGFFNNMTTITAGANFDPYAPANVKTGTGRINTFWYDQTGKPLRFVDANLRISTNISVRRLKDMFKGVNSDVSLAQDRNQGQSSNQNQPGQNRNRKKGDNYQDQTLFDLFEQVSVRHNFTYSFKPDTSFISANSVAITAGAIPITANWNVRIGNIGYDFKSKRLTYPDFTFTRNLHCWEMGLSWQPVRGTYSFYLRVRPGRLDFINIPYQKNVQDVF